MTTTRDIVQRAYRKIGVVAADEPMTADQGEAGVDALNMMMHGWEMDGIAIGHVDLELSDEFTMEPRFHEGCVYLLAARLAPDNSSAGVDDRAFRRALAAAYLIVPDAKLDPALIRRRSA